MLSNCHIEVLDSHHRIIIEDGVGARDLIIYCADEENMVQVKDGPQVSGSTELAVMEGTKSL